ncbi:hypothetical protein ACK3TF_004593 [Chlorella vulgaris]
MKPVVKVLIVVAVVLIVVTILKRLGGDGYTGFMQQEYETVPPSTQPFIVSNVPLIVSAPQVVSGPPVMQMSGTPQMTGTPQMSGTPRMTGTPTVPAKVYVTSAPVMGVSASPQSYDYADEYEEEEYY